MTDNNTTPSNGTGTGTNNNASDPASMLNCTVKIQNLVAKPELNSQVGVVRSYNLQRNRYNVQLYSSSPTSPPIALKADNLTHASISDKAKGQLDQIKTMLQFVRTNPEFRNEIGRMYSLCDDKLPNGIKPEHAIGGSLLLLFIVMYKIGFSKTILLASIVGILISVVLPDIMAGVTDVKVLLRNFPARWRNMIHDHTGYQLTPKLANGILIGILLLSTKVLITPLNSGARRKGSGSSSSSDNASKLTQTELNLMKNNQFQKGGGSSQSWSMEDIYKMGYEDGTANNEYGTSLPENYENLSFSLSSSSFNDFEYDYEPTSPPLPPTQKTSKLGIGTLFSMFALFRTVKELGFADGRFDVNYFKTNVQSMPPLKMAFTGFMVYRVLSAFM